MKYGGRRNEQKLWSMMYAIMTNLAFRHENFCGKPRRQRKERFSATAPPCSRDEHEDNDAEQAQPRRTPNCAPLNQAQPHELLHRTSIHKNISSNLVPIAV